MAGGLTGALLILLGLVVLTAFYCHLRRRRRSVIDLLPDCMG